MKKFLSFALTLCLCLCSVLTLISCNGKSGKIAETEAQTQETEAQTEEVALKEFADPARISYLKDGMTTEEMQRALGAYSQKLGNFAYAFKFKNGLVIYDDGSDTLKYDNLVNPDYLKLIKVGHSYQKITMLLDAKGVKPYNRYGCIGYCLSDGRELYIEFTPDYIVESWSVRD